MLIRYTTSQTNICWAGERNAAYSFRRLGVSHRSLVSVTASYPPSKEEVDAKIQRSDV